MSYIFTKGATSQSIELYIVDSTTGVPELGVLWNTAGIDLKYRRKDAAVVSITEAALTSPALTDTWETGGFLEIGNGVYRLDLPNAALASAAGIDRVVVFGTVTGMVVLPVTIHLTAFDLSTASTPQTADHTAGIADIPTVAEFEARTIVSANYVVVGDTIAGVTLVTTCTTNSDMVGTDNAALASVLGAAVGATISADIADLPTVAEFEARTIVSANYVVVGDTIAGVTSVAANGITATSMAADSINAASIKTAAITAAKFAANAITSTVVADNTITAAKINADAITNAKIADDAIAAENFATDAIATDAVAATALDKVVMSDLAQGAPSATASIVIAINVLYEAFRNKTLTTATLIKIMKDDGTTALMKSTISDDATTFTKGEFVSGA